ncbi:N-acylglucosamine 2-epimerase [candidate division KSB1 bacterium]|nr:AGE family epimerase/isomerase [candidate division KSB1 bacterium]RQW04821.1 MAG: N-acylglucosamine 2-epimerase [candidate division KSB1 bacterium]
MYRFLFISLLIAVACFTQYSDARTQQADEIENVLVDKILTVWYPRVLDMDYGGFLTQFDYKWEPEKDQSKMIVTQARHVWTAAKAAQFYPDDPRYLQAAQHGYTFLREKMWDQIYGGFYQYRARDGGEPERQHPDNKTSYGNAFGLYAVSAYYELSHDPDALAFAKQILSWFEEHAHDPSYGGYFQNFDRYNNMATSSAHSGFTAGRSKDQNTSIHVLEALTELYKVWPDTLVRKRLQEMLEIIRDTIVTEKGSLTLFLEQDWTPVSLQDSSESYIRQHSYRDHVSSGHDVETAFLMLEASAALGLENDARTLAVAKKMVDHAIANAWDDDYGGLYDVGFYFKGDDHMTILSDYKSWWTQMEALNAFLMMSLLFPNERIYCTKFEQQWEHINTYVIDHQYGGVYSQPVDRSADARRAAKAHAWKGPYHTCRTLMNCVKMLREKKVPF